jgi:hypothetical protein
LCRRSTLLLFDEGAHILPSVGRGALPPIDPLLPNVPQGLPRCRDRPSSPRRACPLDISGTAYRSPQLPSTGKISRFPLAKQLLERGRRRRIVYRDRLKSLAGQGILGPLAVNPIQLLGSRLRSPAPLEGTDRIEKGLRRRVPAQADLAAEPFTRGLRAGGLPERIDPLRVVSATSLVDQRALHSTPS